MRSGPVVKNTGPKSVFLRLNARLMSIGGPQAHVVRSGRVRGAQMRINTTLEQCVVG